MANIEESITNEENKEHLNTKKHQKLNKYKIQLGVGVFNPLTNIS